MVGKQSIPEAQDAVATVVGEQVASLDPEGVLQTEVETVFVTEQSMVEDCRERGS
jgi:hypothetical protein